MAQVNEGTPSNVCERERHPTRTKAIGCTAAGDPSGLIEGMFPEGMWSGCRA